MQSNDLRVRSIQVTGVLDEYNHSVEFDETEPFVIIYGPNGVGKTKFLEVINALSNLSWRDLFAAPFHIASIAYRNGTTLAVTRSDATSEDAAEPQITLDFLLSVAGEEPVAWPLQSSEATGFEGWLRKETNWLPYRGDTWQDQGDGEILELAELEARYGRGNGVGSGRPPRAPDRLRAFIESVHTHVIDTQRLKIEISYKERQNRYLHNRPRSVSQIVEYANDMRRRLSLALADNSLITQQLDRTFPSRVLSLDQSAAVSDVDIRAKYESQNTFRGRLAEIALIGSEPELSLPERGLSPWENSMLSLYLNDADIKLQPFEQLLAKITLIETVVNNRLLGKTLRVNAQDGIRVERDRDHIVIELDSLSSGEQHEIILMYNLLFNVLPGSLVLVDEPEISLHVGWQVNFIADVEKIAQIADFQFLVATHSPQIINTWWAYAKQLGPKDAEF